MTFDFVERKNFGSIFIKPDESFSIHLFRHQNTSPEKNAVDAANRIHSETKSITAAVSPGKILSEIFYVLMLVPYFRFT